MNYIGLIPDIPKIYTALAEWISCLVYIVICNKRIRPNRKEIITYVGSITFLVGVQSLIGKGPVAFWIPGMIMAVSIMYFMIFQCCEMTRKTAGYWVVRAFVLAEMTASLEWQLYYFISDEYSFAPLWFEVVFMVTIYVLVFGIVCFLESRQEQALLGMTSKELVTITIIGSITFLLSNLSYVYSNTPFSSHIATEAFNIRTLIGMGGYAFLLAYHIQRCEDHVKSELDAIQNILRIQYAQYRQSKDSIDIINHKYHDLKHQIAILRQERNPERKEEYLDEIEQGIKDYELMFKTGNSVLDTILTGKSLNCARHDITLTCVIDGTLLNSLYVMDLCTIFGNALDNAIEYEVQIEDKDKRLIHVTVSKMNEFILIRFENYFQDNLEFKNDLPVSTKGDKAYHGFGLKSIQYSAQKYNGTLTAKVEDNWFLINILIPIE